MSDATQYWIVKQEPTAYSWDQFVRDGSTAWTGVRNFQARKNLLSMRRGDNVLFYHSVVGKEIVGVARVKAEAYRDPTAEEGEWVCVDLEPERSLERSVSLEVLKAHPTLRDIALVRQSRLSVIPISAEEYREILSLGAAGA